MRVLNFAVVIAALGLPVPGANVVFGQNFPVKPIRIITAGGGGAGDFTARLIAQGLSLSIGQQVIVENRPSGVIPGQVVSQAPPDGYTLLVAGSTFVIGPLLYKTPYDTVRDFSPVTLAASQPNVVVVHPSVPVKSIKELIVIARAKPGELNYGSAGSGSSNHLAAELFKSMAGVNIVRVNYKGVGSALNDLIGGHVQLMFSVASSVTPQVKSGRLRALAVTSAEPSALAPGLPTVAATGLPAYEAVSPNGVFAPAGTPAAIINILSQEIVRVLNRADVKEKFLISGVEVVGTTPEQFAAAIKSEITKWGKVIKDAGIREE